MDLGKIFFFIIFFFWCTNVNSYNSANEAEILMGNKNLDKLSTFRVLREGREV